MIQYNITTLFDRFSFFTFNDCVEIFFLYLLVYYISIWLAKDKKNNLLISFYSFILLIFFTQIMLLPTVTFLLFTFAPALVFSFFIIHQQTLQRNFIALKKQVPQKTVISWPELFVRSCLRTSAQGHEITYVIEHTDHLSLLINASITIDAHLHEQFLELCVQSILFNKQKMVWLTSHGVLYGINATFNFDYTDFIDNKNSLTAEHQAALLLTIKTDALIVKTKKTVGTFDIIMQGSYLPDVPAHQLLSLLKKYTPAYPAKKEGKETLNYGTQVKNSVCAQRSH